MKQLLTNSFLVRLIWRLAMPFCIVGTMVWTLTAWSALPSMANVVSAAASSSGSIYGVAWVDYNRNGLLESQEPLAANQTIFMIPDIDSDFAQLLVLSTNARGEFSATNLALGSYRVWAATENEATAQVVHITDERTVMTVNVPLVGFTLFVPQIVR